ncbi:MerR family transcriptional regulator [Gordonia desulfuricans]|uniref:MerR family transcriptional regulator n=1 Tax=Gordonia desulfuricans TaxID=89051 RepID=A0A7K3LJL3_9ACTN|nr:MerR family transcriptional regulator [Gordonia desulfuricans]NDK88459.1 MerR family transcriptional regulator [Gordonia desulfuricans]
MRIGEVARYSGVSTRMLRHYDSLGLVCPSGRTSGNYREYTDDDVRRIFHVEGLRSLGMSLRQIADALADPHFTPDTLVGDLIRATEERLRRERELLDRLRAVDAAAPDDWTDVLRIVALMRELTAADAGRRQRAALSPPDDALPVGLLVDAVLTEDEPNAAGALQWALSRGAHAGDDVVDGLRTGLHSDDPAVRLRAVRALAEIDGERATEVLTEALADADAQISGLAARTVGRRGGLAAVPRLLDLVIGGVTDVEAAEILGAMTSDGSGTALADRIVGELTAELAAHPADTALRIRLTQALVEIPGEAARSALRILATDADAVVARIAAASPSFRER